MELSLKSLFIIFVIFTIFQRLMELGISKRNEKKILQQNGFIVPERNYLFMVSLHTLWLATILFEIIQNHLQIRPDFFFPSLILFLTGQTLRITAIKTLGERWTTRIVILPEEPAIKKGPFNVIRHPNYLGVILEIVALPMMAGLWKIALVFSLMNFVILYFRIKKEEYFLSQHNSYRELFGQKEVLS